MCVHGLATVSQNNNSNIVINTGGGDNTALLLEANRGMSADAEHSRKLEESPCSGMAQRGSRKQS